MENNTAATIDILLGDIFGWLFLVSLGCLMYWVVWYFIDKFLLRPQLKRVTDEAIEKDKKG